MNRTLLLSVLLLLLPCTVFGQQFELNVSETGKVTSYYSEYWVVQVQGNLTVSNPFNNTFDFVQVPYNLGTLSIIDGSDTGYLKPTMLHIPQMQAFQTITLPYEIRGISAYDPMYGNSSVLGSAFETSGAILYTFMITNIRKSDIENETRDSAAVKSKADRRLVTVTLENPSDLYQNVSLIKVIKTPDQDPTNELRSWYFPEEGDPIIISPHTDWTEDIVDLNSTEGEVYWLSAEVVTDLLPVAHSFHNIRRFTEEDLLRIENASLDEQEYLKNLTTYLEHLMYLKKGVSDSVLLPGETLTVSVKINNFAPINRIFSLTETLPGGFEIIDSGGANATVRQTMTWNGVVNPDTSRHITYTLQYVDNETLGLDYFEPAIVIYENETLFSERIPFVRQYIPEKKVFIQKKLRYSVENEIVVQLQVQNLGESDIRDLYVKEFLEANDVFREITIAPESKGRWLIPVLKKGEVWEVTYVTNENRAVNLLPEVYGIDRNIVLKTLVFENVVHNEWIEPAIKIVEIIAPLFIIGFIIFFVVYRRGIANRKVSGIRQLGKEVHALKEATTPKPRVAINVLKQESGAKKDIPEIAGYDGIMPTKRHSGSMQEVARENLEKLRDIDKGSK
jgi:hypothetical protein